MPFSNIYTTKDIPYAEGSLQKTLSINFLHYMLYCISKIESALNLLNFFNTLQIPDNHDDLLKLCYPQAYHNLLPAPQLPKVISENLDDLIAALSLAGPFAEYIAYNSGTGYYEIDLSSYWK